MMTKPLGYELAGDPPIAPSSFARDEDRNTEAVSNMTDTVTILLCSFMSTSCSCIDAVETKSSVYPSLNLTVASKLDNKSS